MERANGQRDKGEMEKERTGCVQRVRERERAREREGGREREKQREM